MIQVTIAGSRNQSTAASVVKKGQQAVSDYFAETKNLIRLQAEEPRAKSSRQELEEEDKGYFWFLSF